MLGLSGSMINAVKYQEHNQKARAFDGTDQYVNIDNLLGNIVGAITGSSSEFSFSCWFRQGTTSATSTIFRAHVSSNNYFALYYQASTNQINLVTKFGGVADVCIDTSTSYENDGNWHHVVATVSANDDTTELWIDGNLKQSITGVGTLSEAITSVAIGQSSVGSSYFLGDLDEVAFWSRQLSDAEIAVIYNSTASTGDKAIDLSSSIHVANDNLIGYFRFEESSGTIAINSAPGLKNGTYVNDPPIQLNIP